MFAVQRISIPGVSPATSDLLLWRVPLTSAVYLGIATIFLALPLNDILFSLLGFKSAPPLLATACYFALTLVAGLNLWSIISGLTGR